MAEFMPATLVATFDTPEGIWFIENDVVSEIFDSPDIIKRFVAIFKMYAESAVLDIPKGASLREIQIFPAFATNYRIYWYKDDK